MLNPHNLPQLLASAQDKVKRPPPTSMSLNGRPPPHGKKLQTINDQIAEQKSDFELAQARLEALQSMNAFTTAGVSAGLLGKINELERTIPEVRTPPVERSAVLCAPIPTVVKFRRMGPRQRHSGNPPKYARRRQRQRKHVQALPLPIWRPSAHFRRTRARAAAPAKQPSNGIVSLVGDLISLNSKLNAERDALAATAQLRARWFASAPR